MIEKIWYEMLHTKLGDNYLAGYISKQKRIKKWFKIFTLIFSTGGVLGWPIWEYVPVIACVLIAAMQLVTLLENQIIPSDQDIEDIARLRNKYNNYFNKLEKLWMDFQSNNINEDAAKEQFYELRTLLGADLLATDDKLNINGKIKSLYKKADLETRNYFNQYHS